MGLRDAATKRTVYAAAVAGAAVGVPLLLYFVAGSALDARWLAIWIVLVGPLIFQLLSRPRPDWTFGFSFAAVAALGLAVWGTLNPPFDYSGAGRAVLVSVLMFATTLLIGIVGASAASLIARLFEGQSGDPLRGRVRPWHVGAAIAGADVVLAVVLAAVLV